MPINQNLTNFKQKINTLQKSFLERFGHLSVIKKYLPVILTILILTIGLAIGKKIASQQSQSIDIPKPADLPTTSTLPTDSNLTPLKQSVIQFNPQLPDPLMPEFNDSIALEELDY